MKINSILIIAAVTSGYLLLLFGLLYSRYPKYGRFLKLRRSISLEGLAGSKPLKPVFSFLTRNKNGKFYQLSHRMITRSEVNISVQALYLLKILSVIAVTVVLLLVRYTNLDVLRLSIIAKPSDSLSLFREVDTGSYTYNIALYNAVVKRIGEDVLLKLNLDEKAAEIGKVLSELLQTNEVEVLNEKAASLARTFQTVKSLKIIDLQTLLIIFGSFWLPELVLILRRVLLGNMYRKEVIKLENIFELLGSIKGYKTIRIIEEMTKSSKVYRKHLTRCMELFKTERGLALEFLKKSVRNSRFSRLVDVIRVYAMTDKSLALQILERNRLEKEEEILLTAEEDIDIVDLIAFLSIVPILLELATLLMKPLLDTIYEAFKFI